MPNQKDHGQGDFALGTIINRNITDEMHEAYLDYAMSVIVSRALPDVRDGLKPVHRRILYAMWDIGLRAGAKYRKSATVVGEVLGKYHPHGDAAVYDSMVRMAQDFAMRVPLVDGQGNFGSIDGDSAAAMRYTEAKLTRVAEEMLYDIEKDTVDFNPNYDGTQKEPAVLPAKLPNLLLNGTVGIAVGMATSIPPHNLGEICDAVIHLIDCKECSVEHLVEFVKGPDFPTGGIIYNVKDITTAYMTGRGGVVMRAKTDIVETKQGQFQIIIEEIPYQVNKSTLLEKIAELVREKKIDGIRDLRDESSKGEIRVVIELKKEAYPKKVLNQLFKFTQLQDTFHFNIIALVDGIQPRILNLKTILDEFIAHRKTVIVKRTEYDLERARDRAHILQGLKIALDNIDAVIKTIKASKDKEVAKESLMTKFKLSERQSIAILEMRLQQLANLERLKIEDELKEKLALIKALEELLASPKKIMGVIKDETIELRDKFATDRKTHIIKGGVGELTQEDLIPNEPTLVMITRDGYIKRLPPDTFKAQARGGKGIMGLTTKEEDTVDQIFGGMTHNDLLFFTTKGRVFKLKAYDVPVSSRTAKGTAVVNFLQLAPNEKVSKIISLADISSMKYLVMVTKKGLIKKTELSDFDNVRKTGLIAIKLKDDDTLQWVRPSGGNDDIMMVTSEGQSIRFSEGDVRPMGRAAAGVTGIRVKGKDEVVGMDVVSADKRGGELFVVTNDGYGKRTALSSYKVQHRGGSGIKTVKLTAKNGSLIFAQVVYANAMPEDMAGDVLIISQKGQVIRFTLKSVPTLGRDTQGVRVMRFKESGDKVASIAIV